MSRTTDRNNKKTNKILMWPNIKSEYLRNFLRNYKYKFIVLTCFFIIAGFIDLFGIYLIIPVAYVLIGRNQEFLDIEFLSKLNIEPTSIIIIFFLIYLLKFIFLIFTNWY